MTTISTKIKDFKVGDRFLHYGAEFIVTSETEVLNDGVEFYRRDCKMTNNSNPHWSTSGLLANYTSMQGVDSVCYQKIVSE